MRGEIAATREVINEGQQMLDILRKQYALGAVAMTDVLTQEAALAQMMQLLPPLEKALAQQRDLLTALAGQYSTAEVPETFNLKALTLPSNLPLTLPGKFVRQRPDVRAAEANMHSASAQIGVAIAARLPNVTLGANNGYSAYSFAQLLLPSTAMYTLVGDITQPIFDGFTLLNKQKAAEAGLTQAEAQYRQAVITAFQNVADALRALQADTKAVKAADLLRADRQEELRDREEAILDEGRQRGQYAGGAQRRADLALGGGFAGASRGRSSRRCRRPVHGARRRLEGPELAGSAAERGRAGDRIRHTQQRANRHNSGRSRQSELVPELLGQ